MAGINSTFLIITIIFVVLFVLIIIAGIIWAVFFRTPQIIFECERDTDCGVTQQCSLGKCQNIRCSNDSQCNVNGVKNNKCVGAVNPDEAGGIKGYCTEQRCTSNNDCNNGNPNGDNVCVGYIQNNVNNNANNQPGRCVPSNRTGVNNDCNATNKQCLYGNKCTADGKCKVCISGANYYGIPCIDNEYKILGSNSSTYQCPAGTKIRESQCGSPSDGKEYNSNCPKYICYPDTTNPDSSKYKGTLLPYQQIDKESDNIYCSTGQIVNVNGIYRCAMSTTNTKQCLYSNFIDKDGKRINPNNTDISNGLCPGNTPYCNNGTCVSTGTLGITCDGIPFGGNTGCSDPTKGLDSTQLTNNLKYKTLVMGSFCRNNRCSAVQGYYGDTVKTIDACRNYNPKNGKTSTIVNGRCNPNA